MSLIRALDKHRKSVKKVAHINYIKVLAHVLRMLYPNYTFRRCLRGIECFEVTTMGIISGIIKPSFLPSQESSAVVGMSNLHYQRV